MKRWYLLAVFIITSAVFSISVIAHPHMWIDGTIIPRLGPEGLESVHVIWSMDEVTSATLLLDYDTDGSGSFSPDEAAVLRRGAFDHLFDSEYYLVVEVGNLVGTPAPASRFDASVDQGKVIFDFEIPLAVKIRWEDFPKLRLFLFDPSYFIDFRTVNTGETSVGYGSRTVAFQRSSRKSATQGYGMITLTGLEVVDDGTFTSAAAPGNSLNPNPNRGGLLSRGFALSPPAFIKDWGYRLQESLMSAATSAQRGGNFAALLLSLMIAVVFGMVHIIGPGHGKLFTVGYFGSRQAKLSEGLRLSILVNIMDSLSAFLLVAVAYGVLSMSLRESGASVGRISRLTAYAAISILGVVSLASRLRPGRKSAPQEAGSDNGPRPGAPSSGKSVLKPWTLALSVGLIPCPVSSALLAWGIVNGVLGFSLLLVLGVSLGGMIAMTLFSFTLIGGKKGLSLLLKRRGLVKVLSAVEIASMLFLVLAGVVLFLMTL